MQKKYPIEIGINYEITEEHDAGFVFFYNAKEFWKTRKLSVSLVGNGPLLVLRSSGELVVLPSYQSVKKSLVKYTDWESTWRALHISWFIQRMNCFFDDFLNTQSRLRSPNPGSNLADTRAYAIENGLIQRGEARLSSTGKQLEQLFGMDVDISIIRDGGKFDRGPYIPLHKP